jgi:DNA-binding beta-propeller fold protein YncE
MEKPGSKVQSWRARAILPGAFLLATLFISGCVDLELGLWTPEETTGETGTANSFGKDFLEDVTGVAVSGDFLYATDPVTDLVVKLDMTLAGTSEEFVWEAGGTGTGEFQFTDPAGIALDDAGNLYVADYGNKRIQKLSPEGAFLSRIGEGELEAPVGVATDGLGNIYVTDEVLHKVFKYSSLGVKVDEFGSQGNGQGQFNKPAGIAVDFDSNVYVVDNGNFRVVVFSTGGDFVRSFGGNGTADGMFRNPYGVTADSYRHVMVGDRNLNKIQRFDQDGTFLNSLSTANPDGALMDPMGLAAQGTFVYIAESGAHRIREAPFSLFTK